MPNDTFYGSSEVLLKLAPMLAPIYHRLNLYVHYFFVPNRLLWSEWETFITGGRLGPGMPAEDPIAPPVPPYYHIDDLLDSGLDLLDNGSLADYLGVPNIPDTGTALWGARTIDAMPFAAYYRCWYDYYRDRNYTEDNAFLPMQSGYNANQNEYEAIVSLKTRAWQHDYFTSALTSTQRGAEVLMPLEGSGSVTYDSVSTIVRTTGGAGNGALSANGGNMQDPAGNVRVENIDEVNITNSAVSINDLRRAVRLQEWLERNQLAGSRYNESIMAHFGRKTSDSRLQRAEYIGGGKAVVQISEIMTTAYSEDAIAEVVPPGNPVGRGSTYADTNRFSYNCEEHGFIVAVLSVMPSSAYMQGIPRMFNRRNTFLDYPWPSFAHLGEQEVYDSEIYMDPTTYPVDRTTDPVFGYQSRYADWKHIQSSSHGDFRTTLDIWHLTRKFDSVPNLNESFVTFEDELQDRIFNVTGVSTVWMYIYNKLNVKRSLPYFGTPQL